MSRKSINNGGEGTSRVFAFVKENWALLLAGASVAGVAAIAFSMCTSYVALSFRSNSHRISRNTPPRNMFSIVCALP